LQRLKAASQRGNFPLTRIYTGTDELVELAELWEEHLNMAFPAVPIFFYNELDGRGPISIRDSFREHYRHHPLVGRARQAPGNQRPAPVGSALRLRRRCR
jgi:hypothetical protein